MDLNHYIIIIVGCIGMLLFDAIGAVLSNKFKFNYSLLTFGSILIFGSIAYFTATVSQPIIGIFGAIFAGFIDATLGQLVAKYGNAYVKNPTGFQWKIEFKTVIIVMCLSGLVGLLSVTCFI